jgi:hypothetical protein
MCFERRYHQTHGSDKSPLLAQVNRIQAKTVMWKCCSIRSRKRSLSAGERQAGIYSITRMSEFNRANGFLSLICHALRIRRSVSIITVAFFFGKCLPGTNCGFLTTFAARRKNY